MHKRQAILLFFSLVMTVSPKVFGQDLSQESIIVELGSGINKVSTILGEIHEQTGILFTYDTKIVDQELIIEIGEGKYRLGVVLDSLVRSLDLQYTVIGNNVVFYRDNTSMGKVMVRGRVLDDNTGDPLVFAHIAIRGRSIGTVTNVDGDFVLNIPVEYAEDQLTVSYVGFQNSSLDIREAAKDELVIGMVRDYIPIQEVIINVREPISILDNMVRAIPDNYGSTPALLTGFYREGIVRKKELQVYSEAVIQVYKAAYVRSLHSDQIKVLKSRKIENLEAKDTLAVRLAAGVETTLSLDGARRLFDFIDPSNHNLYDYNFTDMVTIDDGSAFVITFVQNSWIEEPLFRGELYIDTYDNAIVLAEFELNPDYIDKLSDEYISRVPGDYSVSTEYVRYSVRYRKSGGRYFLSHVRGDLGFQAKGHGKLFNSHYNVFVELAVTGFETDSVSRFERNEIIPPQAIFTRTIKGYDSEYWKGLDFIKPDESLEKSLRQLEVKLGEYDSSLQ